MCDIEDHSVLLPMNEIRGRPDGEVGRLPLLLVRRWIDVVRAVIHDDVGIRGVTLEDWLGRLDGHLVLRFRILLHVGAGEAGRRTKEEEEAGSPDRHGAWVRLVFSKPAGL